MFRRLHPLVAFFLDVVGLGSQVFEEWTGDVREYREALRRSGQPRSRVFLALLWQRASLVSAFLLLLTDLCLDVKDQAVGWRLWASKRALKHSDYQHANTLLTKALESLQTSPPTAQRAERLLKLHTLRGTVLAITRGFTASAVAETYSGAQQLCTQAGSIFDRARVLGGLWRWHNMRAELPIARARGQELLTLAQQTHDPSLLVAAHLALGATAAYVGEFAVAHGHLVEGMTFYDRQRYRSAALLEQHTADPKVGCLSIAAWVLQLRGYPDQALQSIQQALTLAQKLSHPFSLAYAQAHAAVVYQLRREAPAARTWAAAAIAVSSAHVEEQAFAMWWAMGSMLHGWALAEQAQAAAGMAQTRQALAAWRAPEAELAVPYWSALLVEAYRNGGQIAEGLRVVEEMLAAGHNTGQRFFEAELHRLKGELFLEAGVVQSGDDTPPSAASEACFHQALAVAGSQHAKSLELRAAMSLGRLWQQQGKRAEAHDLLAPIYGWFTEGFDTTDLQQATRLLAEVC